MQMSQLKLRNERRGAHAESHENWQYPMQVTEVLVHDQLDPHRYSRNAHMSPDNGSVSVTV
jgi:hypothetical protein